MKYNKMAREKCNMLNIWNFEFKIQKKKKRTKNCNIYKSTKKENANTDETKLRDTKIFQTEVIWNYQDRQIWITSLDNKLNFTK